MVQERFQRFVELLKATRFVELLMATWEKWNKENASQLAAALSFYTALSLAPLLVFVITLLSFVLSSDGARITIITQMEAAMGESGADLAQTIINNAPSPGGGVVASLLSLGMLIFSASSLFNQIQLAFNQFWNVPQEAVSGIVSTIVLRLRAFAMVFGVGLIFLLLIAISLVIRLVNGVLNLLMERMTESRLPEWVPDLDIDLLSSLAWLFGQLLPLIDWAVSLLVVWLVLAGIFRMLPRLPGITRRDVRGGAFLAAVLLVVGKSGLTWYLGSGATGSAYGAAGSLIVLLLWVYYSAQIVFLGAAWSFEYTHRYGSRAHLRAAVPVAVAHAAGVAVAVPQSAAGLVAETPRTGATLPPQQRDAPSADIPPATAPDRPPFAWSPMVWVAALLSFLAGMVVGFRDRNR
jgi:membrane protein